MTLAAGLCAMALSQRPYGTGAYPQFRNLSALPGGGFGVTPEGEPGLAGALSYSTPIGYSLGSGRFAFGLSNISPDNRLRFADLGGWSTTQDGGNATMAIMGGVALGEFRLTASAMVLSSIWDNAFNFQLQVPTRVENLGLSVGLQDLFGDGGAAGGGVPGDDRSSRSVFAVGTLRVGEDAYVSAGIGDNRFAQGFANASFRLSPSLKAFLEHDGYGAHYGLAWGSPINLNLAGRRGNVVAMVGQAEGRAAFWSLSIGF